MDQDTELYVKDEQRRVLMNIKTGKNSNNVKSVTSYDAEEKVVLSAMFYPDGAVKEVVVKAAGICRHRWGFYEDGKLEFASEFPRASSSGFKEVRQYYDREGNPTRSRRIHGHSGSGRSPFE